MSLVLGVLGGMGPAATLDFLGKLQAYTPTETERDHIRTIVDINPQVPDLNDPFGKPAAVLSEMAGALQGAGAEVLAIACNSAHVHADTITRATGLPLVDMIGAASAAARDTGAMRAGVLGTRQALRLYREYLAAQGMGLVTLPPDRQEAFVALLDRVRRGDVSDTARAEMTGFAQELVAGGAEVVIAGCTEVPLVMNAKSIRQPFVDASDELARRCVAVCLGMEPVPAL